MVFPIGRSRSLEGNRFDDQPWMYTPVSPAFLFSALPLSLSLSVPSVASSSSASSSFPSVSCAHLLLIRSRIREFTSRAGYQLQRYSHSDPRNSSWLRTCAPSRLRAVPRNPGCRVSRAQHRPFPRNVALRGSRRRLRRFVRNHRPAGLLVAPPRLR